MVLSNGETIHNAFFDRSFKGETKLKSNIFRKKILLPFSSSCCIFAVRLPYYLLLVALSDHVVTISPKIDILLKKAASFNSHLIPVEVHIKGTVKNHLSSSLINQIDHTRP